MRLGMILVGIILLALGIWVVVGNLHYDHTETKAQFGPVKVQATSEKPVPVPLGYAGIAVGGVLIIAGALKKSR